MGDLPLVIVEIEVQLHGKKVAGENRIGSGVDESGERQGAAVPVDK